MGHHPRIHEAFDATGLHVGTVFSFEIDFSSETGWLRIYVDAQTKQALNKMYDGTA